MHRWSWSCGLIFTYAPRPLVLSLSPNRIGWPRMKTGDAAFEKHFRLAGAPPEILQRAFDAELRSRLLSGPLRDWIFGEDGTFELDVRSIVEDGQGGPRALLAAADVFVEVARRVCGEFDQEHARVTAHYGPEAAATWWTQQVAAVANVQGQRRVLKMLILGGFIVATLLMLVVVAVIAFLF